MSLITKNSNESAADKKPSFVGGLFLPPHSDDAATSLRKALDDGFDYAVAELPAPEAGGGARARADVTRLESRWWSTSVVGMVCDPPPRESRGAPGARLVRDLTGGDPGPRSRARRREAASALAGMLEFAGHVNVPAVILPPVPSAASDGREGDGDAPVDASDPSAGEYARVLGALAASSPCAASSVQLWIRVPLSIPHMRAAALLLQRCGRPPQVGCMLSVSGPVDSASLPAVARELHLFVGSGNVKALSFQVGVFLKNKKNYPALSKSHQFVFSMLFGRLGRTLRLLVEGDVAEPGVNIAPPKGPRANALGQHGGGSSGRLHHLQYLRHLRSRPPLPSKLDSPEALLERPYLDRLQSPLQPLGDHLEHSTYETFERDPVKYESYGEAIRLALRDGIDEGRFERLCGAELTAAELREALRSGSGEEGEMDEDPPDGTTGADVHRVTILVAGAGRGPLVRQAARAVSRASAEWARETRRGPGKRIKALCAEIVAVEKNPSAILYLRASKEGDPSWNGGRESVPAVVGGRGKGGEAIVPGTSNVTVVGCDMREAADSSLKYMVHNPNLRADVVVSELLGSFGDNELSPECLDGVQRCGILKDSCVSIPQSYTSFLAPVSSTRLHNEAKAQSCHPLNPNEGPSGPSIGLQRAMETPYVVRSHAASQTHNEQECWTFAHPHVPSKPAAMDTDGPQQNLSANAAKNIINDRRAHLSFGYEPTHGAALGCGYGPADSQMLAVASASAEDESSSSADDTTLMLHGFLGTFHSVLYESKDKTKSSVISIAPHSFSVGMFSWFPLYFPLKEPLRVPPGASVDCSMWRRCDNDRVWYEWCAEAVMGEGSEKVVLSGGCVHNPGGRSYHVRL